MKIFVLTFIILFYSFSVRCQNIPNDGNLKAKSSPYKATTSYADDNNKKGVDLKKLSYYQICIMADSFFYSNMYENAIGLYNYAFDKNNNKGMVKHRFNLASCYSLLNQVDNAFVNLFKVAEGAKFTNYFLFESDKNFKNLHKDSRWGEFLDILKSNSDKVADSLNSKIIPPQDNQ